MLTESFAIIAWTGGHIVMDVVSAVRAFIAALTAPWLVWVLAAVALYFGIRRGALGLAFFLVGWLFTPFAFWSVAWSIVIPILSVFRFDRSVILLVLISNGGALVSALTLVVRLKDFDVDDATQLVGVLLLIGCVYVWYVYSFQGALALSVWETWCHNPRFDGIHKTPYECTPFWMAPRLYSDLFGWR